MHTCGAAVGVGVGVDAAPDVPAAVEVPATAVPCLAVVNRAN